MHRIMFVCLGNICRSPMAEFLMKYYVKKNNVEHDFIISSSATSDYNDGLPVYGKIKPYLDKLGVNYKDKVASQLQKSDYDKYDYFIGMDNYNIKNMKNLFGGDKEQKVRLLRSFGEKEREIDDPYYTGDFDKAFKEIEEGVKIFLEYLMKK